MKKRFGLSALLAFLAPTILFASGLPKESIQMLTKTLQDSNTDVRTAAARALADLGDDTDIPVRPVENALIVSADPKEQDALCETLVNINDKSTFKRLSDALVNPQFTWAAGAKAKAIGVIGKVGGTKAVKELTDLASGDGEPAVRVAALLALGHIGAPPKKEDKK